MSFCLVIFKKMTILFVPVLSKALPTYMIESNFFVFFFKSSAFILETKDATSSTTSTGMRTHSWQGHKKEQRSGIYVIRYLVSFFPGTRLVHLALALSRAVMFWYHTLAVTLLTELSFFLRLFLFVFFLFVCFCVLFSFFLSLSGPTFRLATDFCLVFVWSR